MRILFFIMGVGAGNTSRNLAIFRELRAQAPEVEIHIAAQGKALELLRNESLSVYPLREVTYASGGEFTWWNIITSNLGFPMRFVQNVRAASRLIRRIRPELVVADSDFYCLGPARELRVPLASINNSAAIVEDMRRHGVPPNCGFSARFIERTDYWLQRRYPEKVICPVLKHTDGLPAKFRQIPPIVRQGFVPLDDPGDEVIVVTGGSGIGAQEMDLRPLKMPASTYGTLLRNAPPHARQLGFSLNIVEAMRRARVLVVQGGFSSVSEAMALRRPTVVVPISRHAEQHVNARMLQESGIGLCAAARDVASKIQQVWDDHERFASAAAAHPPMSTDGASQAAQTLLEMLPITKNRL